MCDRDIDAKVNSDPSEREWGQFRRKYRIQREYSQAPIPDQIRTQAMNVIVEMIAEAIYYDSEYWNESQSGDEFIFETGGSGTLRESANPDFWVPITSYLLTNDPWEENCDISDNREIVWRKFPVLKSMEIENGNFGDKVRTDKGGRNGYYR